MTTIQEKIKLKRHERKLLKKLSSIKFYTFIKKTINTLFLPVTIFFIIWKKWFKKAWWVISLSTYKLFWKKIAYIDDFIIDKKSRGQWFWTKLINSAIEKTKKDNHDYITLVSQSHRKESHFLYKKIWFTVISCGLFIFAYKKIKNNKKTSS